jgi:hypothetical protein
LPKIEKNPLGKSNGDFSCPSPRCASDYDSSSCPKLFRESISANILSEYKKDSVPAKGCHENLAGELIFEYVGVNITCSLLVSETEFQYK